MMKRFLFALIALLPASSLAAPLCDLLAHDQDGVSLAVVLHNDDGITRKTDVTNVTSGLTIDIWPGTEAATQYTGADLETGTAQTYATPTTVDDIIIAQEGTTGFYALHTRDEQWDAVGARWALVGISGVTGMMDFECIVYMDAADSNVFAKEETLLERSRLASEYALQSSVQVNNGAIQQLEQNLGNGTTTVELDQQSVINIWAHPCEQQGPLSCQQMLSLMGAESFGETQQVGETDRIIKTHDGAVTRIQGVIDPTTLERESVTVTPSP